MRTERSAQAGQASVEFVVIATALAAALLLRWADGLSPAELLLGVLLDAAASVSAWLAVV
jgi:hypothetical protein